MEGRREEVPALGLEDNIFVFGYVYDQTLRTTPFRNSGMGLHILPEDLAKFEMRYSRKLRLETTALTILVRPYSILKDIMQGNTCMERIMGPATITILNFV
jgi:hypothetical protein